MDFVIAFMVILFSCLAVYAVRRNRADAKENKAIEVSPTADEKSAPEKPVVNNMEQRKGTRTLFLETLTKIGCQYDIGEGQDDRIHFAYQGEHFLVDAEDGRAYVTVYDYTWGGVSLSDIDEVARLRRAINETNWRSSVNTVFSIDNERNTMDVHCKSVFPFIPEMPKLDNYLKVELNEFFLTHRQVGAEMQKLREKEEANNQA